MSVYVDTITTHATTLRYKRWSHLFADTLEELHSIARAIGLKRSWFQDRADFPHYDVVPTKRAQAVKLGAIEVDRHFVVARLRENREKTKQVECQNAIEKVLPDGYPSTGNSSPDVGLVTPGGERTSLPKGDGKSEILGGSRRDSAEPIENVVPGGGR